MVSVKERLRIELRPKEIAPASFVDNAIYVSPIVFEFEQRNLFQRIWTFVCHESELKAAGSYREVTVAGMPLLVWRGGDMRLRAFYNACRHRGAKITRRPAGGVDQLECFYHLWRYSQGGKLAETGRPEDGAGALTTVQRLRGYAGTGFRKEDFPLVEVHCESYFGFVFVSLSEDPPSIREFLSATEPFLAPIFGSDFEVFHYHRATIQANWKLWCDNNREIYHVLLHYLNRKSAAYAGAAHGQVAWEFLDNGHARFGDPSQNVTDYAEAGYDDRRGSRVSYPLPGVAEGAQPILELFPDVMINIRSNVVRVDRLIPVSPGLTIVEFRGLAPADDTEEQRDVRLSNHNLVWGPFGRNLPEDILAVEAQWRAISTGAAPFSLIARQEGLGNMDDESLRSFYAEWSRWVGLPYWDASDCAVEVIPDVRDGE